MKTSTRQLSFIPGIHRATHRIGLWLDTHAPSLGVSQGEAHLLAHLAEVGPSSVADLHRAFAHKRSTLTSYLDRLEKRGAILREAHKEDRRSFLVSLTAEGNALALRVHRRLSALENTVLRQLAPRDLSALNGVLQRLQDATDAPSAVQPTGRSKG